MKPALRSAIWLLAACLAASCAPAAAGSPLSPTIMPAAHSDATATRPVPTATALPSSTATLAPDVNLALGDRALLQGDFAAAQTHYQAALTAGIEPDRAAFFLARAQLDGGDAAGARTMLQNLLAANPSDAFALRAQFLLGEANDALKDWNASAAAYEEFLTVARNLIPPVTGLDALVLERIGDAYSAAGNTDLAVQSLNGAAGMASQGEAFRLQEKEGDTLLQAGLQEPAMTVYDRVLSLVSSDGAKARLNRKVADILFALGRKQESYQRCQTVLQFQESYDAYLCLSTLVDAGFTPDDLARGIIDFNAGAFNPALLAFNRYMEKSPVEPARALYYRGLSFRALDQAAAAVVDLKAAAAYGQDSGVWADSLFELAYTLWAWQDDFGGGSAVIASLAASAPANPRAPEALDDAARIAERGGDLTQAAKLWNRLADAYPASDYAAGASHLAGISLYRMGEFAGAEPLFARQAASADSATRARALFWTAKARAARGDSSGTQTAYAAAAAADPTGYYSERAKDILAGRAPLAGGRMTFVFNLDDEYREAEAWLLKQGSPATPATAQPHYTLVEDDARLARGRLLWDLGLYESALAEFTSLRTSLSADPLASLYLSRYLVDLGCYPGAIFSARQALDALGLNDAQTLSAPRYFGHVRFGPYFAELLVPQAVQYKLDPLLLFALVRQESRFALTAVSPASAHGLMQLIPSTAESMATQLGMTGYAQGDLYRPVINIQLGSAYLAQQRDSFQGDLFLALAAYNAGPGYAAVWGDLAKGDDDLLLEVIRFAETRTYIRSIYEQYAIYRDLYTVP
jgi:soluble lytic murein transglycosylase